MEGREKGKKEGRCYLSGLKGGPEGSVGGATSAYSISYH